MRRPPTARPGDVDVLGRQAPRAPRADARTRHPAALPLARRAYEDIRDKIHTFELLPGQLVIAQDLADELGTSVTPVHAALQRLSTERLVEVIPRSGYVIAPITLVDVQEIFSMRVALESLAVELGVTRATGHDLDEFRTRSQPSALEHAKNNAAALRALGAAHDSFHLAVAELSHHRRLADTIRGFLDQSRRLTVVSILAARMTAAGRAAQGLDSENHGSAHGEIAAAILRRDREAAVSVMAGHIRAGYRHVIQHLATLPTDLLVGHAPAASFDFAADDTELDIPASLPGLAAAVPPQSDRRRRSHQRPREHRGPRG